MTKKLTTESFIQKSVQRWGRKFDYSKTVYVDSETRVVVGCPIHGDVEVLPESHTMKRESNTGCPRCGQESSVEKRRKGYTVFIDTANELFDGKFIYIESSWKGLKKKIEYICPIHGKRSMKAESHIQRREGNTGCKLCGINQRAERIRMTFKQFEEEAKRIHGDLYEYSSEDFTSASHNVKVWCKVKDHGYFCPIARDHLIGTGCPECKGLRKKTTQKFIQDAIKVHGNLYGYKNADYQGARSKLKITCFLHGDFPQEPANHLSGAGCPDCADLRKGWDNLPDLLKEQEKHREECQLYLYTVQGYPDQVKPGISSDHQRRAGTSGKNIPYGKLISEWVCSTRIESRIIELAALQDTHHLFDPPWELTDKSGFYELRKCDPDFMKSIIQLRHDQMYEYLADGGSVWRWAVDHIKMPEDIKKMYLQKINEVEKIE